jgi:hypothetical protein
VDDGVRSTNRFTQLRFQTILEGLVERYARTSVVPVSRAPDFEPRVSAVLAALQRSRA